MPDTQDVEALVARLEDDRHCNDWYLRLQAAQALRSECARTSALEAQLAGAKEALVECEEYFDNRADADCDQDGFIPNKEMLLLTTVREALASAPASAGVGLEDVLAAYEEETRALPLGAASREKGDSAYNWRMSVVKDLRELAARLTPAEGRDGKEVRS